jgi:hypothetical protein
MRNENNHEKNHRKIIVSTYTCVGIDVNLYGVGRRFTQRGTSG